ncbi:MAG: glycoside hydrolase family 20 zincin-like fold domain-containing protein [Verrucomicrobia bacterium]|nr:glycoside hydrolase family 20 zincin-like fold domain-containing protein [Verrucomicrobiota bacterium]
MSEIRIWGRPFKQGESQPQKIPYRQNEGKEAVAKPVELGGLPDALVFPLPQELEKKAGARSIGPTTKIAIAGASNKRARMTAETLQEALFVRTGLNLAITETLTPGAIQIREDSGVTEKAGGYLLDVNSGGITVTGKDATGAFYGSQSLAQIVSPDGKGGWQIPFLRIRDWPATPIRYVSGGQPVSSGLVRALARYKINYYAPVQMASPENRAMAEKYCVKLVPNVPLDWAWGANPEEFTERAAGEALSAIGTARRNPCPSHPGVWEAYFKQMDARIDATDSDLVNINCNEMYAEQAGARWNVCARCRARNLSGQELWVETLKKIQGHLHERGRKLLMIDCTLAYKGISHPGDAANDWSKIPDLLPPEVKKDMVVFLWHWDDPVYDALVRNRFTILRWRNAATFPKEHGFPGPYSGFYLDQSDGPMDISQVVAMAQLCWSPNRSNGAGADLPAATSAAQADADRFLELAVAAIPMWAECSANRLPASRQSGRGMFSVDLKEVANRSRQDDAPCDGRGWVDLGSQCDLRALPSGQRALGGVPFTIIDEEKNRGQSAVMVENRGAIDRQWPCRVDIPVGRKAASLCFLHALSRRLGWNYLKKEELSGYYFIVYDDGTYDPFEIKYPINAANWDGKDTNWNYAPKGLALSRATLAWRGQTRSGQTAALYAAEWTNPRPHALIRKIVFASPQIKTGVSPILLAVTGFEPVANDADDPTVDKLTRLRPVALLAEPSAPGKPIDLSDGIIESKRLYVTRDGIRVSTASPFFESDIWSEDYQGGIAHVVWDNNRGIKCANSAAEVVVELPAQRRLGGVGVIGQYRNEYYTNDFPPALIDYTVEVSPEGKTWEKIADVTGHIPEEEGLRVHSFAPRLLKTVRITARNNRHSHEMNSKGGQIAFIQLYEAPQDKKSGGKP